MSNRRGKIPCPVWNTKPLTEKEKSKMNEKEIEKETKRRNFHLEEELKASLVDCATYLLYDISYSEEDIILEKGSKKIRVKSGQGKEYYDEIIQQLYEEWDPGINRFKELAKESNNY